jgi:ACS family hexuronate transporter-like MFS transporter
MNDAKNIIEEIEEPKSASEISPPASAGASATGAAVAALDVINERIGRRRWLICALLFFAATINYIDRQVIGILKPTLQTEIGWTEVEYSWIVFSFQAAYAIGLLLVGGLIDKIGTRLGSSLSITVWSIAAMAHALAHSVMGFCRRAFRPWHRRSRIFSGSH